MSSNVTLNGVQYVVPAYNDTGWAQGAGNLSLYLAAIASNTLQPTGGAFTLTADVDFGSNFGLKALFLKTETVTPATAGVVRLAVADTIGWRNNANNANLALGVDNADQVTFGAVRLLKASLAQGHIFVGNSAGLAADVAMSGDATIVDGGALTIANSAITNAKVSASAAIAYSKLALTGSVVNADIAVGAAIAYSKLALTGTILNADLAGSIAYSKLTLTGAIVNADISASAAIAYSKLALTGSIANGDLAGAVSIAKGGTNSVASLSNGRVMGSVGGAIVELALGAIPGAASAVTVAAGNIGETISAVYSAVNAPTSGQFGDGTNIILTPGVWAIFTNFMFNTSGATLTGTILCGIGTTTGNNSAGLVDGKTDCYLAPNATQTIVSGCVPASIVSISGNTTYYAKIKAAYTGGPPAFSGYIVGIRIA